MFSVGECFSETTNCLFDKEFNQSFTFHCGLVLSWNSAVDACLGIYAQPAILRPGLLLNITSFIHKMNTIHYCDKQNHFWIGAHHPRFMGMEILDHDNINTLNNRLYF